MKEKMIMSQLYGDAVEKDSFVGYRVSNASASPTSTAVWNFDGVIGGSSTIYRHPTHTYGHRYGDSVGLRQFIPENQGAWE
ncbi:hypothetical protein WG66_009634 [Moniliophthora roreri]|nr:hypothetical protein WG66_009634 [Moniliophthora roreri]